MSWQLCPWVWLLCSGQCCRRMLVPVGTSNVGRLEGGGNRGSCYIITLIFLGQVLPTSFCQAPQSLTSLGLMPPHL